ncbi:MAG TPA: PIG-L deacetylase family protein [Thermomicrobiales bacterium]|nr:PIG-L deacetylase family protein [Thermomicrobiales bacterium]
MTGQEERRAALVIVAHPDDAEFGCAGTVAAWAREGWEVYYAICTDAAGGGPDEATDVGPAARQRITETRHAEQRAACQVLGVRDVVFLDYPDGRLQPTLDLRRDLVRLIRRYRPARVVCPSPVRTWEPAYAIGRYHPDHLAAGEAALAACYPAAQNPWDFPELLEEGLTPHKIGELYIMGAPNENHVVDISATIDQKIAALRAHESQLGAHFEELEKMVREWTAKAGEPHGLAHAERFHLAAQR